MSRSQRTIITFVILGLAMLGIAAGLYWHLRPTPADIISSSLSPSFYSFQEPTQYNQQMLIVAANYLFTVQPLNAQAASKTTEGNIIKYIEAYTNTDVVQTRYTNKLKEDIILKQPGHPDSFAYQIDLAKYDFAKDSNGDLVFYAKGKRGDTLSRLFTIPAPFMIDAKGNKSKTSDVKVTLTDQGLLTIEPNKDWLTKATYPITLDPTIEINILNVYSHPQQGEDWIVNFTTQGQADLKIIPNDQATVDDDEFVSLSCLPVEASAKEGDNQNLQPQILAGDIIYYPNWSCAGTGQVVHKTLKAGHHTLRFEFGDQTAYAYNAPDIGPVTIATAAFASSTRYTFQRKIWHDGSRYWEAYVDGSSGAIFFKYSATGDSGTWVQNSNATILDVPTSDFSIDADSNNAFIAYQYAPAILVRHASSTTGYPGTGFSWGSANWVIPAYEIYDCDEGYLPTIARDTSGKIRVMASVFSFWDGGSCTQGDNAIRAYSKLSGYANNATYWSPTEAATLELNYNSAYYTSSVVPLAGGDMLAVYASTTSFASKKHTSGVGWGSATVIASKPPSGAGTEYYNPQMVSNTSADEAYLVYIDTSYHVVFKKYTDSSGTWGSAVTIDSNSGNNYSTISIDTAHSNKLYVFWIRSNTVYMSTSDSPYTSWSSPATLVSSGTSNKFTAAAYQNGGNYMPLVWADQTGGGNSDVKYYGVSTSAGGGGTAATTTVILKPGTIFKRGVILK